MGAPKYGLVGEAPQIRSLVVGVLDAAIRTVGVVKNGVATKAAYSKGTLVSRGSDGKYALLTGANLDTAVAAFPGQTFGVLDEDIVVEATSEETAQVVLKGEIARDMVILEATAFEDLDATVRAKVENLLTGSGLIPRAVKR
nr:hypothetical protein [uncultured Dethiosulfovibrio sp.]